MIKQALQRGDVAAYRSVEAEGYQAARTRDAGAASYYLNNLAGSYFQTGELGAALECYTEMRDLGLRGGEYAHAAVALLGLSSLYLYVFDLSSALASAADSYSLVGNVKEPRIRAQIVGQFARALMAQGETARATALFHEAIELCAKADDSAHEAQSWALLGAELTRIGDLESAENALNNSYRIRLLAHLPDLAYSQYYLSELHLRLGNTELAGNLIDAAIAAHTPRSAVPAYLMHATRARIHARRGDLEGALESYLRSADAADEWRSRGLFADSFQIGADVLLAKKAVGHDEGVYDGAIATAAALYERTHDKKYAVLAWQLNERIRSASLHQAVLRGREWTRAVPAAYWTTLDELREVESEHFGGGTPTVEDRDRLVRLRLKLAEMEAKANAQRANPVPANEGKQKAPARDTENFSAKISLIDVSTKLGNSRKLVSFHTDEQASYRWVIGSGSFEMKALPGRREMERQVQELGSAMRKSPDVSAASFAIYSTLFGGIESKKDEPWLLVLDQGLFDLPAAALRSGPASDSPYLVALHSLEVLPGAWALFEPEPRGKSAFVGAADGVYNTADSRYRRVAMSWKRMFAFRDRPLRQWPRLAGSAAEAETCARKVGRETKLITGAGLTRASFLEAIAGEPGYIHLATHFLTTPGGEKTAIALGLTIDPFDRPRLDILTAEDIATARVPGAVVVMSGCGSAQGEQVPAAGVIGLARAWLSAGAQAVIATLWPTPDEPGGLVTRFYDHLGDGKTVPAEALRRAQLDMLETGGWRADPGYWAAYQLMGRSN